MARRFSRKKGKSGSTRPVRKTKPAWVIHDEKEVEQLVIKLAKSGKTSSEIGIILRDSYGIPDVRIITKKKINKILEENKLSSKLPEDLIALIRRQVNLMKHIEHNKMDMTSKRGIQLTESKIKGLVKYYKKIGKLPKDWSYDATKAKLLIE